MDASTRDGAAAGRGGAAAGFGRLLRGERERLGLTLEAVAERAGCTKGYLSQIETGRKGPPSGDVLRGLEAALGLPAGRLEAEAGLAGAPASVREGLARAEADRAAYRRLVALLGSGSLDEAYRSGFGAGPHDVLHEVHAAARLDPAVVGVGILRLQHDVHFQDHRAVERQIPVGGEPRGRAGELVTDDERHGRVFFAESVPSFGRRWFSLD